MDRKRERHVELQAFGAARWRMRLERPQHGVHGIPRHRLAALAAVRPPDACEEQPQVVVDLRGGADGRAGVAGVGLLLDGHRGTDALDQIHVRLVHPLQELPCVGGEALDVPALAFGVERVECQAGLPGPADAGDDNQCFRGSSSEMFFRLWTRAPRMTMVSCTWGRKEMK